MWDILPREIRRQIIEFNPSLRQLHYIKFKSCLKTIKFLRYERMCVECSRQSIFGNDNRINRKPSVKMYYKLENSNSNARVSCSCLEHSLLSYNSGRTCINNGIEMDYGEIFNFIRQTTNISSIICYVGLDEDHMDIILGLSDDTFVTPISRWQRLVFVTH